METYENAYNDGKALMETLIPKLKESAMKRGEDREDFLDGMYDTFYSMLVDAHEANNG